jgi:hypothetical protein
MKYQGALPLIALTKLGRKSLYKLVCSIINPLQATKSKCEKLPTSMNTNMVKMSYDKDNPHGNWLKNQHLQRLYGFGGFLFLVHPKRGPGGGFASPQDIV